MFLGLVNKHLLPIHPLFASRIACEVIEWDISSTWSGMLTFSNRRALQFNVYERIYDIVGIAFFLEADSAELRTKVAFLSKTIFAIEPGSHVLISPGQFKVDTYVAQDKRWETRSRS